MQVEKPQYFKNSTILTQLKSTPHPPLGSKNKESQEKALTFKSSICRVKPNIETYGKLTLQILPQKIKSVESFS